MYDKKDEEGKKSVFEKSGPVKLGMGQTGEKHLGGESGQTGYTQGAPFDCDKYVHDVISGDTKVPTSEPSSVRSDIEVPHMGDTKTVEPPPRPTSRPVRHESGSAFQGRWKPTVKTGAVIDPAADIRGNIIIGKNVRISAGTIISGHEEEPVLLSPGCAIFEGAVLTVLPIRVKGQKISSRLVKVEGQEYPLYIGEDTVIAPRAQLTGPCYIGHKCFIGAGSHIFWAKIGNESVIEPGAFVMNVEIPPGHFVPSGLRVTSKDNVKSLPKITDRYRFRRLAEEMLEEIRSRY